MSGKSKVAEIIVTLRAEKDGRAIVQFKRERAKAATVTRTYSPSTTLLWLLEDRILMHADRQKAFLFGSRCIGVWADVTALQGKRGQR